jgi:hypothetical protein
MANRLIPEWKLLANLIKKGKWSFTFELLLLDLVIRALLEIRAIPNQGKPWNGN